MGWQHAKKYIWITSTAKFLWAAQTDCLSKLSLSTEHSWAPALQLFSYEGAALEVQISQCLSVCLHVCYQVEIRLQNVTGNSPTALYSVHYCTGQTKVYSVCTPVNLNKTSLWYVGSVYICTVKKKPIFQLQKAALELQMSLCLCVSYQIVSPCTFLIIVPNGLSLYISTPDLWIVTDSSTRS